MFDFILNLCICIYTHFKNIETEYNSLRPILLFTEFYEEFYERLLPKSFDRLLLHYIITTHFNIHIRA